MTSAEAVPGPAGQHAAAAVDVAGIVARLRAAGCVFAEDEADVMLATTTDPVELDAMLARRCTGEPLEHVVGWAQFAGIRVIVHPAVFVPRRRTEALVRAAVGVTRPGATVLDLCCGTGAIGAAIASAVPGVRLCASDVDPAAVRCAEVNLAPFDARVFAGDLDSAIPESYLGAVDVLVANVPYVPSAEVPFLPAEAREHEARVALDGGADWVDMLRRVAQHAPRWLRPYGWLFAECTEQQASAALAVVADEGLAADQDYDEDHEVVVVRGQRVAN